MVILMNRYIKSICSVLLLLCSVMAFSNQEKHSYSLVINQGNCSSQAIIYEIDNSNKAQIVSTANVSSISNAKYLGYNSSLRFQIGSISIVDLCLEKLAENFYTSKKQDDPININSIVIGIAAYDKFKADTTKEMITLKDHFTNHVLASLKKYNFNFEEESIILIDDSKLVTASAIQLQQHNILESQIDDKHCDNIWTYFQTSLAVAMKSPITDKAIPEISYTHYVNSGYFQLGINTVPLFTNIKDESDKGDSKVQELLSSYPLADKIFEEKKCTIAYWLKENPSKSTKRNNARALFLADYVLSKYMESSLNSIKNLEKSINKQNIKQGSDKFVDNTSHSDTNKSSIEELMLNITKLINKSVDELVKLLNSDSKDQIGKNDYVFIAGDFLRSKFVFNNYQMILNKKITDESMKKRVILVPYNSFLSGLALAAEHIKSAN